MGWAVGVASRIRAAKASAEACVAALRASGEAQACVIGRVLARSGPESVVALRAGHP